MASLLIRDLDEVTEERLRIQAAHHGRSMEAEAREILKSALPDALAAEEPEDERNFATAIHKLFEPFGGIDLPEFPRIEIRDPPDFK